MSIIKILLIISVSLYISLTFSSCSNDNNLADNETTIVSDITESLYSQTIAITNNNIVADETTLISSNVIESLYNQAYVGLIDENEFVNRYGYLYDIDLDGTDEVLILYFDQVNEVIIYKDKGDKYTIWGESIMFNNVHPEWFSIDELTLYYDPLEDNYFYINEYDVWEKYFNYADINKYLITDNGLVKSNIAHCEFLYGEGIDFSFNTVLGHETDPVGNVKYEDMVHYHNDIDEYLNQFEKIKVITKEDLTLRPLSENSLE